MEYCEHGDLRHHLHEHGVLPEPELVDITWQLLQGLQFMHENDFAHRDLKPANILIECKPPVGDWHVKICDLGLSRRMQSGIESTTVKGTPGFMPPESTPGIGTDPRNIDPFPADMWCLGETTFQLCTGSGTFEGGPFKLRDYYHGILPFPAQALQKVGASDSLVAFISSLMKAKPDERLTAEQANEHAWMSTAVEYLDYPRESEDLANEPSAGPEPADSDASSSVPSGEWTVTGPGEAKRNVQPGESKAPVDPPRVVQGFDGDSHAVTSAVITSYNVQGPCAVLTSKEGDLASKPNSRSSSDSDLSEPEFQKRGLPTARRIPKFEDPGPRDTQSPIIPPPSRPHHGAYVKYQALPGPVLFERSYGDLVLRAYESRTPIKAPCLAVIRPWTFESAHTGIHILSMHASRPRVAYPTTLTLLKAIDYEKLHSRHEWARLRCETWEEMVLIHCVFMALKYRSCLYLPDQCQSELWCLDEEITFRGTVIDDGFEHKLLVLTDPVSNQRRLQAIPASDDMVDVPIWTAFITKPFSFKRNHGARIGIKFNCIRFHNFCKDYDPERQMTGDKRYFELCFQSAHDASMFCEVFDQLQHGHLPQRKKPDMNADPIPRYRQPRTSYHAKPGDSISPKEDDGAGRQGASMYDTLQRPVVPVGDFNVSWTPETSRARSQSKEANQGSEGSEDDGDKERHARRSRGPDSASRVYTYTVVKDEGKERLATRTIDLGQQSQSRRPRRHDAPR